MKTKTPKSRKVSAPNIQDSLGGAGSLIFKEYINEKKAIDLNKNLKITLTAKHLERLNKVLSYYASYSSTPKHVRNDVHKALESLNNALNPIIAILSPTCSPSIKKSLQERLLLELVQINANGLPDYFTPRPEDIGLDNLITPIDTSFLFDDESSNRVLSNTIILKSATESAIQSLIAEATSPAGGRPTAPMRDKLINELEKIHDSACANKDSYGKEKRRDRFCAKIFEFLPTKIRPKLEKLDSAYKKRRRAKG